MILYTIPILHSEDSYLSVWIDNIPLAFIFVYFCAINFLGLLVTQKTKKKSEDFRQKGNK